MIEIESLQELCNNNAIRWSAHAMERLLLRGISRNEIMQVIQAGEIIEQYPDDYPYPSCLISGIALKDKYLHIVCGLGENTVFIITAYYPDKDKWESDFKTRKKGL